ncbi:MAG: hypothetical protein ACI8RD_003041 [Bacillariaceae sp.]|jgi:hypothetical protein
MSFLFANVLFMTRSRFFLDLFLFNFITSQTRSCTGRSEDTNLKKSFTPISVRMHTVCGGVARSRYLLFSGTSSVSLLQLHPIVFDYSRLPKSVN